MAVTPLPGVDASSRHPRAIAPAALACMGIVFGDIGTSPLYTLQVTVKAASPSGMITSAAVLGIVSLIFWSLIVVSEVQMNLRAPCGAPHCRAASCRIQKRRDSC
jgi:KUP system potassium uptake protein